MSLEEDLDLSPRGTLALRSYNATLDEQIRTCQVASREMKKVTVDPDGEVAVPGPAQRPVVPKEPQPPSSIRKKDEDSLDKKQKKAPQKEKVATNTGVDESAKSVDESKGITDEAKKTTQKEADAAKIEVKEADGRQEEGKSVSPASSKEDPVEKSVKETESGAGKPKVEEHKIHSDDDTTGSQAMKNAESASEDRLRGEPIESWVARTGAIDDTLAWFSQALERAGMSEKQTDGAVGKVSDLKGATLVMCNSKGRSFVEAMKSSGFLQGDPLAELESIINYHGGQGPKAPRQPSSVQDLSEGDKKSGELANKSKEAAAAETDKAEKAKERHEKAKSESVEKPKTGVDETKVAAVLDAMKEKDDELLAAVVPQRTPSPKLEYGVETPRSEEGSLRAERLERRVYNIPPPHILAATPILLAPCLRRPPQAQCLLLPSTYGHAFPQSPPHEAVPLHLILHPRPLIMILTSRRLSEHHPKAKEKEKAAVKEKEKAKVKIPPRRPAPLNLHGRRVKERVKQSNPISSHQLQRCRSGLPFRDVWVAIWMPITNQHPTYINPTHPYHYTPLGPSI